MIIRTDEQMHLDTAVAALRLAEALDWHFTKPREKDLPPLILEELRLYRRVRDRVPAEVPRV